MSEEINFHPEKGVKFIAAFFYFTILPP